MRLFWLILLIPSVLFSQPRVAVYDGFRVWDDGLTATLAFLDHIEVDADRISAAEINDGEWVDDYDAIWFPGGYAWYYTRHIRNNGQEAIRQFVNDGGVYVGVCAGAFFAADIIVWEGDTINYPLDLFDGTAIGPLEDIAEWPNHTMTELNLNEDHSSEPDIENAGYQLYYGGPYLERGDTAIESLAKYSETGLCCALTSNYGDGKLLLIATHPEIEEDDDRDNNNFGDDLDDDGSDWDWLAIVVNWLLPNEDEENVADTTILLPTGLDMLIYPNPFNANANLQISVLNSGFFTFGLYDLTGKQVQPIWNGELISGNHTLSIDGSGLSTGNYYIQEITSQGSLTKSIILLK